MTEGVRLGVVEDGLVSGVIGSGERSSISGRACWSYPGLIGELGGGKLGDDGPGLYNVDSRDREEDFDSVEFL